MRGLRRFLAVMVVGSVAAWPSLRAQDKVVGTVKDGVMDEIKLYAEKLPAISRMAMKQFSATDADITVGEKKDETKKMQTEGPPLLAETFAAKLRALGPFTDISALAADAPAPADALVVTGKFVELDPGSRAKRYFVGFGAGKSGVTVEGVVTGPGGAKLATFSQRRVGVMGVAGGDSMDKLRGDTKNIAGDIAKFLSLWANGKSLK